MSILADQHMHTNYSFDSEASMESMVLGAIEKGLKHINFTDHNDFDYPVSEKFPEGCWDLNVDSYLYQLLSLREKYKEQIEIGFGIEIGLQDISFRKNAVLGRSHEFDFIIGSTHLVKNIDVYEPVYFEGRSANASLTEYFNEILKNIRQYQNFDVLGHLDYITRRLPGGEDLYKPSDYMDIIDEILNLIIENEKGIELNTSALNQGLRNPNPCPELIKRYKELGGEIITVGSDAHCPENIATHFKDAEEILVNAGYKYYSVFKDRVATFTKL